MFIVNRLTKFIPVFILLSQSCAYSQPRYNFADLVGRWGVPDEKMEYVIEFRPDSIVVFHTYIGNPDRTATLVAIDEKAGKMKLRFCEPQPNPSKQEGTGYQLATKRPEKCEFNYTYKILEDRLIMQEESSGEEFTAFNCLKGYCDEQKEFFRNTKVDIDLPVVAANDLTAYQEKSRNININVGKLKPIFEFMYLRAGEFSVSIENEIVSNEEELLKHLTNFEKAQSKGDSGDLVLFIDKEVKMKEIQSLLQIIQRQIKNLRRIGFAVRINEDVKRNFQIRIKYIDFQSVTISQPEETFDNWIK